MIGKSYKSVYHPNRVFFTDDADFAAFTGDLAVCMDPERKGGFNGKCFGCIRSNSLKSVVFSLERSGQSKQNQGLRKITHRADIEKTIIVIRVGSEHKAAAFKTVKHTGRKEHIADIDRFVMVYRQNS